LSILIFLWGLPQWKNWVNGVAPIRLPLGSGQTVEIVPRLPRDVTLISIPVHSLHEVVQRVPPVAPAGAPPEKAVYTLNWISATGSGILTAAVISGLLMGFSLRSLLVIYWQTIVRVRYSLVTIAAMLAIGYVTKYSGSDATLGLALAKTGRFYAFFGTLL